MRVLITGGDGFIGSHVSRQLVQKHEVSILTLNHKQELIKDIENKVQIIEGDITDENLVKEAMNEIQPEVIVHLAAFGIDDKGVAKSVELDPETAFSVNITGTYYLYCAAVENNVKQMILSSSTTVYPTKDKVKVEFVDESFERGASNLYGLTKVMVEKMADYFLLHYKMPTLSLRLPLVYGPGRWYRGAGGPFVDIFEAVKQKQMTKINGTTETLDLMYVKDVAYLIDDIVEKSLGSSGVVNVKSHSTSIPEMIKIINSLVGEELLEFEKTNQMPVYPLIRTDTSEKLLNFQPRFTIKEACQDFLEELELI